MNTSAWRCLSLVLGISVSTIALAQSLADSPMIFRAGVWDVHRTTDAMTDASVCTAVYNGHFDIALSENMLSIAMADHVKSVRLRFDEEQAQPVRAATASEFKNSRIEIGGGDFAELLDSRRLRYEAVTVGNLSVSGDIDLTGIYLAQGNVAAGCAGNPIVMSMPPPPAADKCTPELRQRMADNGIPAANIDQICRN
jgi:hypothetical protein